MWPTFSDNDTFDDVNTTYDINLSNNNYFTRMDIHNNYAVVYSWYEMTFGIMLLLLHTPEDPKMVA